MEFRCGRLGMQVRKFIDFCMMKRLISSIEQLPGHDDSHQTIDTPDLAGNENLYDLQGQITHKIDFIERFVPQHVKVILIAYSVGARISMELLQHPKFSPQIIQCYLMFPTLERFAESAGGRIFPKIDQYFFICRFFSSVLYQFPTSFKYMLMKTALWSVGYDPSEFHEPLLQICCPQSSNKLWFLALDSYNNITDLNESVIEANAHRLKIYYGERDVFVRKKFYYDIIKKFPHVDAELCTKNIPHTFMMKNSIETADMLIGWIKEKLENI